MTSTFPYLVSRLHSNRRFSVVAENRFPPRPAPGRYVYYKEGLRLEDGSISPAGKRHIIDDLTRNGRTPLYPLCIVWNPNACTYILKDRTALDGTAPPESNAWNLANYETPIVIKDVTAVELPEDYPWSHLCIRRLGDEHVEIASGAPLQIGDFRHVPKSGPGRELARHLDNDGSLIQPEEFRGVKTTGVLNETILLGPIQPDGKAQVIVARWPQLVFDAAQELAGRSIPTDLLKALWKAVE